MFLAWNYTLELFFWIILSAIILVSLTILLTSPIFRSKKSETSEETLLLTGKSVDSPKGKILDQDTASGRIEEELEILEEIEKRETKQDSLPLSVRIRAYAIILAYVGYVNFIEIVGILFLFEGLPEQTSIPYSSLDYPGGGGGLIFIIVGFATLLSGLISLYGFLANRNILVRDSCRAAAVLFLLLAIFGTGWDDILGFVIIPLLFSGDLKRVWKWVSATLTNLSNENENKEEEVTPYMEGKAAAVIFGYSLFSLLIFYIGLAWESRIENDPRELDKIFSFLLKCLLLINGFTLYYGFYQNNTNVLKISGRIVAFIFFIGHEDMNMGFFPDGWNYTFFLLGLLALLSSGDLKRLWERMTSNEEEDVTQFGKWVGNILKLLREKWMTLNTYTGIRYLLYLLFFLSIILFLAVLIFQFF